MKRILKKSDSVISDILDDDKPKPKGGKTKYVKAVVVIDDEMWSDEERDYQTTPPSENQASKQRLAPKPSNSTKLYNGKIQIQPKTLAHDSNQEEKEVELELPLPYLPSHVHDLLPRHIINMIWKEFLLHDCDETELLLTEHIPEIAQNIFQATGRSLPFHQIPLPFGDNEYTDFSYVMTTLCHLLNQPGVTKPILTPRILLPPCCARQACQLHTRIEEKYQTGTELRSNFRLDVIYRRHITERNGVVRICHIPGMLEEAAIPYDLKNLPERYMTIHGDELITDYQILFKTVQLLRGDLNENSESLDQLYSLPRWLQNEFTSNEILLFRHHFMMIDIDCGGTIDKNELQLLGESLGNTITEEEAMKIIAEHDINGEGSLNFEEFMTLMFQIMRGTIDMQNDLLAKTMIESRNQIIIFQEIETIKSFSHHHPSSMMIESSQQSSISSQREQQSYLTTGMTTTTTLSSLFSLSYVKVLHYGGIPVICEYLLNGPIHSLYDKGKFIIQVVYNNGYPFQCPTVTILTRLLHLNFLPLISGSYTIPHLEAIWDSAWTTKDLLEHIYELLQCPNPRLLPYDMIQVYNRYITEFYDVTDETMYITSVFHQHSEVYESHKDDKEEKEGGKEDDDHVLLEGEVKENEPLSFQRKTYREVLERMPRMQQYHMNLILKYFVDNESYEQLVRQAVTRYARRKEDADSEEEEGDEFGVEGDHRMEAKGGYSHVEEEEETTIMTSEYSMDDAKYEDDYEEDEEEK
jgi:ubiquitin-protein ligase